jgi:hypothetical protein
MAKTRPDRRVTRAAGACFVALALAILVAAWESAPVGAAVAAIVVGLLGVEALISAARDRPSLLSRIGPLP